MPPTIQPPGLRHLQRIAGDPSNGLQQLVSRQGLEGSGTEGPPGKEGKPGTPPPVSVPTALTARTTGEAHPVLSVTTTVYLSLTLKAENSEWEVKIDGQTVFKASAEVLTAASLDFFYTLRVKTGGTWEVLMVKGAAANLESSYQEG